MLLTLQHDAPDRGSLRYGVSSFSYYNFQGDLAMIRRITLAVAAAVALILTPTAAMAFNAPMDYNAPGYATTVSDSTPAVGQNVTVILRGGSAIAGKVVTLTITGPSATKVLTATANAGGVAHFTTTFGVEGVYTLTMTVAGVVVSTQTVTVHAAPGAAAAVPPLARTGFDPTGLLVGGGLLVLAGAGAVVVAKRRRSARVSA